MVLRRIIQTVAVFLTNAYWLFPFSGSGIYTGRFKAVCAPGLNCWSCPAATTACPIGALQNSLATVRFNLGAGNYHFGLYVLGWLGLIGTAVGRMPCGWVCPFGFFQELVHKIPSRKFGIPRVLTWLKYPILALFVVLLPLFVVDSFGFGQTWFCKYICPAGTLEAGLPAMGLQSQLRPMVGWLFAHKVTLLLGFLVWMVFASRPFCRVACPLGALYSLFNKVSFFRMRWDEDACVHCQKCYQVCPMGVKFWENANHYDCIRCLRCYYEGCQFGAISYEWVGLPERVVRTGRRKQQKQQAAPSGGQSG
ncbi:4Fe-4S binding protein [Desulfohalobium retbaense]|uniref:4Fe-4S ferredoxin iron-sulfur binding domain protein n=1 Tax=Desulfohalobium retbaense (strain ATCC 49708 / DSM 5692 / JCM 16813 / HR100) TaxID=485915 RepID=C8X3S2_DESRD|nr:4Fe-4S binding protein [Desulfohalobium retbaense]ACV69069.1 4Fe-4S ferredoxin iron-sulfur binding domain protein [Desulfohalobium retbaense DSM 5692]